MNDQDIGDYLNAIGRLTDQYDEWVELWATGDETTLQLMKAAVPRVLEYFDRLHTVENPSQELQWGLMQLLDDASSAIIVSVPASQQRELFAKAVGYAAKYELAVPESVFLELQAQAELDCGNSSTALRLLDRALAIAESTTDLAVLIGPICSTIAGNLRANGRLQEAKDYLKRSLRIARTSHAEAEEAADQSELGVIEYELGNYKEAEQLLRTAVASLESLGHWLEASVASASLACVLSVIGNEEEAKFLFESSLGTARRYGDLSGVCRNLISIASVTLMADNPETALQIANHALQIATDEEISTETARAHYEVASAYFELDRLVEAIEALHKAEGFASKANVPVLVANCQSLRARVMIDADQISAAIGLLEDTRRKFNAIDEPHGAAGVEFNLALAYAAADENETSARHAVNAYRQYRRINAADYKTVAKWARDDLRIDVEAEFFEAT